MKSFWSEDGIFMMAAAVVAVAGVVLFFNSGFSGESDMAEWNDSMNAIWPQNAETVRLGTLYNRSPQGDMYVGLKRNVSVVVDSKDAPDFYVETNAKGLRNEPFSVEKPEGVTRILVVGGSITFGSNVNRSQRYTSVLERRLNANSSKRFQVINAGIFGVGMKDYYLFLKEKGMQYDPDIVVVAFSHGDSVSREEEEAIIEEAKNRVEGRNTTEEEVHRVSRELFWDRLEHKDTQNVLSRYMGKIENVTGDARLLFYQIGGTPDDVTEFYREWGRRKGVDVVFLPREFLRTRYEERIFSKENRHPRPFVHEWYADKLYRVVMNETEVSYGDESDGIMENVADLLGVAGG